MHFICSQPIENKAFECIAYDYDMYPQQLWALIWVERLRLLSYKAGHHISKCITRSQ
jgi:hypothetical protein